jgi:hypothetical protein
MKEVILVEFNIDNIYSVSEFSYLGVMMFSDDLVIDKPFIFRVNGKNKHIKIIGEETIYTSNSALKIYLVCNANYFEMDNVITNHSLNKYPTLSNYVDAFKKDLINGIIDIDYKSFDRKTKITGILNEN